MEMYSKGLPDTEIKRQVDLGRQHGEDQNSHDPAHELQSEEPAATSPLASPLTPELEAAYHQTELALQRMLTAAIAFCDGCISSGQLHAVRELLREQEQRLEKLEGKYTPPFLDDLPSPGVISDPEIITAPSPCKAAPKPKDIFIEKLKDTEKLDELTGMLVLLDQKIARLEQDFQQGRINASQYRAIRKHYLQQKDVASRLRKTHPESDRWKVVLEEGKTSFLLQLNEASVRCVAFFDIRSRKPIFSQGELPMEAEEAVALLSTFGASEFDPRTGRMVATHADDGTALVLIPGRYTAALICFTQDPPGWQVRALREVHRNFEAANKTSLERGERRSLIFPDLRRFFKS